MSNLSSGGHDERFTRVVDVFEDQLVDAPYSGASLAVYLDGQPVIDRWGGIADMPSGRAWGADTATLVFSCTKSVTTIVMLRLAEQGVLSLDDPVADYWPEFGAYGKSALTLRHVMSHRAGLPYIDADVTFEDVLEGDPVLRALEAQTPWWEPGSGHAYHALTGGIILGEVVRRTTGKSLGTILREDISRPLDLDLWIGLPASETPRVALTVQADPRASAPEVLALAEEVFASDDRPLRAATLNGALPFPLVGTSTEMRWNDPRIWATELPAATGIGTARAFAKLHASLVSVVDGARGSRLLSDAAIDDATAVQSAGPQLTGVPLGPAQEWGSGFMLPCEARPMLGATSFGHDGAAGALTFADADQRIGFAYLPSRMGDIPDTRANDLVDTLATCLEGG